MIASSMARRGRSADPLLSNGLAEHCPDTLLLMEHDPVFTIGEGWENQGHYDERV